MSYKLRRVALLALPLSLSLVSACGGTAGYPRLADLQAVTEAKPIPTDEIATDPQAEASYNAAVESWGDRLWSAGGRLCRYFDKAGMKGLDCPE